VKQGRLFKEDLELDSLERSEKELARRQRQLDEEARRIQRDKMESARTLPPSEEIKLRAKMKEHHEMLMTRGEVANMRREQNSSLLLFVLLLAATAGLVWWGLRLMQQG
jgi:hypothetical protein